MGARLARMAGAVAVFAAAMGAVQAQQAGSPGRLPMASSPPVELRTLHDVFLALELCWQASLPALPVPGMTVRIALSFKRNGEMFGEPKFTFVTPGVPTGTRVLYQRAASDALTKCNPLPFSEGLGNAAAGRPFLFQFIDRRTEKGI
jgi:hypothetical protein